MKVVDLMTNQTIIMKGSKKSIQKMREIRKGKGGIVKVINMIDMKGIIGEAGIMITIENRVIIRIDMKLNTRKRKRSDEIFLNYQLNPSN